MKKILIIDNHENLRKIYKDCLTIEGFKVWDANNASDGIAEIFKAEGIDLVLLDINMPGTKRDHLMRMADDYDLHFKIIVSSSCSVDEQKGLMPSADDYFDKAEGMDVLIQKVKRILR